MFKHAHFALLIQNIHEKRSIIYLTKQGFLLHQIGELLSKAQDLKYLALNPDGSFTILPAGYQFLVRSQSESLEAPANWISPLDTERVPTIDKLAVYLPSRRVIGKLITHQRKT